ncbi:hypothetical protein CANARDRAFT_28496 [[Candida] arabinofermentans NRRL YB-2248]|uniref:CSC1/OSCA1-like 7TM region domain-containing protein n=1 Tax=[Candida] arabinofermentans NRRL YB-2248 TaxID=983967 RepID=A0A1E4T0I0_9ASCO|nr:hypothetical protein CANARDRAFT_28496 [[Candida] arabinofermentans NRRL YB-2248]
MADEYLAHIEKNLRDAPSTRLIATQLMLSTSLGLFAFFTFCVLRCKFPNIFMARLNYLSVSNRKFMPPMLDTKSLFGWMPIVWKINEADILEYAGLDAFVFLGFFKMSIKLLSFCWLFSVAIISPIRYYYTGDYDQGDDPNGGDNDDGDGDGNNDNGGDSNLSSKSWDMGDATDFKAYLWLYVIFTYIFTFITTHFLMEQSRKVIKYRQKILGNQNSITDRTIRLSGIPPELRSERALKECIEKLGIGKIDKIVICREWKKLNKLFKYRENIVSKLELHWSNYIGNKKSDVFNIRPFASSSYPLRQENIIGEESRYHDNETINEDIERASRSDSDFASDQPTLDSTSDDEYQDNGFGADSTSSPTTLLGSFGTTTYKKRPKIRLGFCGLWGRYVDAIDYYTNVLSAIDEEILLARQRHYPATPTAFITMDSVATAQVMAQAVLDPRVSFLITRLAPAPKDIIWENVTLPRKDRIMKIYYITILTGILGVALVFPVGYLATLLNLKTISKFWPYLGEILKNNQWAQKFVTELLPVYLFTILNFLIPHLYVWLSSKQGFISHGEEELSVVSKNFFYVFVNLFLVFTLAGTASNYWGYLSDTKKLALQLAASLRGLSSFYVDTIILQGLGIMPFKLLLVAQLIRFPFFKAGCKTPRQYRDLYKPPLFNFGIQLPHPMLTLVITLLYSVMSTKILTVGLLYFIIGHFVFKYQLIYSCIHPQHSTGQVMPIIFRRVVLGLLLFQLTVAGSLALSNAYVLSMCLAPLPIFTLLFLWNFQKNYLPLSFFIALRAIDKDTSLMGIDELSPTLPHSGTAISSITTGTSGVGSGLRTPAHALTSIKSSTIDERRELNQTYEYPYLVQSLDGPWLAIDSEQIIMATHDGTIRKRFTFEEF